MVHQALPKDPGLPRIKVLRSFADVASHLRALHDAIEKLFRKQRGSAQNIADNTIPGIETNVTNNTTNITTNTTNITNNAGDIAALQGLGATWLVDKWIHNTANGVETLDTHEWFGMEVFGFGNAYERDEPGDEEDYLVDEWIDVDLQTFVTRIGNDYDGANVQLTKFNDLVNATHIYVDGTTGHIKAESSGYTHETHIHVVIMGFEDKAGTPDITIS